MKQKHPLMQTPITTDRLLLREFLPQDAEGMFLLNQDPVVMRYTGDVLFESAEDALKLISTYSDYTKNGFGR